jgi:hypothetical protein
MGRVPSGSAALGSFGLYGTTDFVLPMVLYHLHRRVGILLWLRFEVDDSLSVQKLAATSKIFVL